MEQDRVEVGSIARWLYSLGHSAQHALQQARQVPWKRAQSDNRLSQRTNHTQRSAFGIVIVAEAVSTIVAVPARGTGIPQAVSLHTKGVSSQQVRLRTLRTATIVGNSANL